MSFLKCLSLEYIVWTLNLFFNATTYSALFCASTCTRAAILPSKSRNNCSSLKPCFMVLVWCLNFSTKTVCCYIVILYCYVGYVVHILYVIEGHLKLRYSLNCTLYKCMSKCYLRKIKLLLFYFFWDYFADL